MHQAPDGTVQRGFFPPIASYAFLSDCEPAFESGRKRGTWEHPADGYHEVTCTSEGWKLELVLVSDLNLGIEGPRATARHLMKEGDQVFCALAWSPHPPPRTFKDAYE